MGAQAETPHFWEMFSLPYKSPDIVDRTFTKPLILYNFSAFHLNPGILESLPAAGRLIGSPTLLEVILILFLFGHNNKRICLYVTGNLL